MSEDFIDIKEPRARPLSKTEEVKNNYRFLKTIHFFLLIYLTLHNLLIPIILNIFRTNPLLTDVHYWFLAHLVIFYLLKVKSSHLRFVIVLTLTGSITRFLLELSLYHSQKITWGLFSIGLSEISASFFCILYLTYFQQKIGLKQKKFQTKYLLFLPLAILTQFALNLLEIRGASFKQLVEVKVKDQLVDWSQFGCQGSHIHLTKMTKLPFQELINIKECGFTKNIIQIKDSLLIKNDLNKAIPLRLYQLKKHGKRFRWKFVQYFLIKVGEQQIIPENKINQQDVYMLKSIEQKELGMLILVSNLSRYQDYQFEFTPNSITHQKKEALP